MLRPHSCSDVSARGEAASRAGRKGASGPQGRLFPGSGLLCVCSGTPPGPRRRELQLPAGLARRLRPCAALRAEGVANAEGGGTKP